MFEAALKDLNPAQREAVDTIEGPVLVVAGPGTGKTQILSLRIVNILRKTDTAPENILALTFTDSGARAMRERLSQYIGSAAYRVPIHTFHSFADMLIKTYPDLYPGIIGGRPAGDIERIELLETVLNDPAIKLLRPLGNPGYYVSHILRTIALMKQEYITPDDFAATISTEETALSELPKFHEKGAHTGKVRGEYTKKEREIEKNRELPRQIAEFAQRTWRK